MTTETKVLTAEQLTLIKKPLPKDAVKDNPVKKGFSTIRAIYVTERLNEVFGVGVWQLRTDLIPFGTMPTQSEIKKSSQGREYTTHYGMVKTTLSVPEYGIHYECIAGSQNEDAGDSLKGAATDSITKICSWIGIGIDVFKGEQDKAVREQEKVDKQEQEVGRQIELEQEVDKAIKCLIDCHSNADLSALRDSLGQGHPVLAVARFKNAANARYHEINAATNQSPIK